jgi:hypothetical protein
MRRDNLGGEGEMGAIFKRGVGRKSPPPSADFPFTSYSLGSGSGSGSGSRGLTAPSPLRRAALTSPMNPNSTTVYALGMAMPSQFYLGAKYFSAPCVFIPVPGARPRMVSHAPPLPSPLILHWLNCTLIRRAATLPTKRYAKVAWLLRCSGLRYSNSSELAGR